MTTAVPGRLAHCGLAGFGRPAPMRHWLAALCLPAALFLLSAAGCASKPAAAGHRHGSAPSLAALAADYMAIARPANRRLEHEAGTYRRYAHRNLRVAEAQLRAEAVTEQWFDHRLLRIPFPAAIGATAHALVAINKLRIALTKVQARATSIASLLAFTGRHRAADAQVEAQVRIIRSELGLPPPETG